MPTSITPLQLTHYHKSFNFTANYTHASMSADYEIAVVNAETHAPYATAVNTATR